MEKNGEEWRQLRVEVDINIVFVPDTKLRREKIQWERACFYGLVRGISL